MRLTLEEAERIGRECGGNPTPGDLRGLLGSLTGHGKRGELKSVEFKADFDGSTRAWLQLIVEGVALANSGGGVLIYGVSDDGQRVGSPGAVESDLDSASINNRLRQYSPQSTFRCATQAFSYYRRTFVAVGFASSDGIIVFDKDGNFEEAGKTRVAFRSGPVYIRRTGQKAPATQAEVTELVRRLSEAQAAEFLTRVQQVTQLPAGVSLVALPAGNGHGGLLLTGSEEGIPVRVEVNPDAETVPVSEIADASVPFSGLRNEVVHEVRFWKQGHPSHRAQRSTLADWYVRRGELPEWDPAALEFGLRSALRVHGFPNWWAAQLPVDVLKQAIHDLIAQNEYPTREYLPYLIGSQFWERREELWRELEEVSGEFRKVTRTTRRLAEMDFATFVGNAKGPAKHFQWKGAVRGLPETIEDTKLGKAIFGEMLAEDARSQLPSNLRPALHQLDIALHSRGAQ